MCLRVFETSYSSSPYYWNYSFSSLAPSFSFFLPCLAVFAAGYDATTDFERWKTKRVDKLTSAYFAPAALSLKRKRNIDEWILVLFSHGEGTSTWYLCSHSPSAVRQYPLESCLFLSNCRRREGLLDGCSHYNIVRLHDVWWRDLVRRAESKSSESLRVRDWHWHVVTTPSFRQNSLSSPAGGAFRTAETRKKSVLLCCGNGDWGACVLLNKESNCIVLPFQCKIVALISIKKKEKRCAGSTAVIKCAW